jgi:hypothetical protein
MHQSRRASGKDMRWKTRRNATGGERQRSGGAGPIIVHLCVALGMSTPPASLGGQTRELKSYGSGAPEAKLMLYYSSTVAFSPLGVPFGADRQSAMAVASGRGPSRIEAAVELSYLPPLSAEQRTVGTDKPESTNLAPVFARPRVGARLPAGLGLELSWIPPVRLFGVKANLFGGAISRSFSTSLGVDLVPRASFLTGRVEGPITCNSDMRTTGDAALATYYSFVCYGNDSQDFFEPRHVSGELLVSRTSANGRWQPYASAGARWERTRFDIGVIRGDGTRDPDEPILEVKATRGYGTVGASWFGVRRTRLATELYYAPGSALTVRALAGVHLW